MQFSREPLVFSGVLMSRLSAEKDSLLGPMVHENCKPKLLLGNFKKLLETIENFLETFIGNFPES